MISIYLVPYNAGQTEGTNQVIKFWCWSNTRVWVNGVNQPFHCRRGRCEGGVATFVSFQHWTLVLHFFHEHDYLGVMSSCWHLISVGQSKYESLPATLIAYCNGRMMWLQQPLNELSSADLLPKSLPRVVSFLPCGWDNTQQRSFNRSLHFKVNLQLTDKWWCTRAHTIVCFSVLDKPKKGLKEIYRQFAFLRLKSSLFGFKQYISNTFPMV